jgi:RAD51-like protein 3
MLDANTTIKGHTFLLVIDTITPLLGPLLSAVSAQGHAYMVDIMRQLQDYARNSSATVIVRTFLCACKYHNSSEPKIVNNSAGQGPHSVERKPALGPSFALMTDTTLWLQKIPGPDEISNLRSIQIIKSRSVVRAFLIPIQIPSF